MSVHGCERACGARGRRGGRPATVLSPEDRPFSWCPSGGFALHPDVGPQAVWPLGSVSPPGDAGIGDSRAGPPRRLCVTVAGWGPSPCSPSSGSQTCGEPRPELGGPLSARPTLPPPLQGPLWFPRWRAGVSDDLRWCLWSDCAGLAGSCALGGATRKPRNRAQVTSPPALATCLAGPSAAVCVLSRL